MESFDALKAAQATNPNIGRLELGMLYAHVGMPDDAKREVDRAIELDPTSDRLRTEIVNVYWANALYDQAIQANQALPARSRGHTSPTSAPAVSSRRGR